MNSHSHIQRIRKQRIKRQRQLRILYFVVILFGGFTLFAVLSLVTQSKGTGYSMSKTAQNQPIHGVAGEKTTAISEKEMITPSSSVSIVLSPVISPTPQKLVNSLIPTNTPISVPKPTTPQNRPEPQDPNRITIASYLKPYSISQLNPTQGTIRFKVKADWDNKDTTLFLGNFDGEDKKNLFEIIGIRNLITFGTYDSNASETGFDASDANLGADYLGKTFEVVTTWNFSDEIKRKRIYINGELKLETELEGSISVKNPQILTGDVSDLYISDKWEDH